MFKNKFNINDNLISISFDDLITAVHCNEKIISEDAVRKVFRELTSQALLDAKYSLDENIKDILKVCKDNR